MKYRIALMLVLALCAGTALFMAETKSPKHRTVEAAGLTRSYELHVPPNLPAGKAVPLVIVFHGSGDTGAGMESFSKFDDVADREGFIVAYPDAIAANWNDGREATGITSQFNKVDDVAFTSALIKEISTTHAVDAKRVYATGFSNGAIFVHYLAAKLPARLAAVASVSGGIAEPLAREFKPAAPLSIFIIHGSKDALVPFEGGDVDYGGFGCIISTTKAVEMWIKCNAIDAKPESGMLPDINTKDNCRVSWSRWISKANQSEILLYTIEGGGHTWPGGSQFLPVNVIGNVDRDFNATEAIWDFFKKHPQG